MTIKCCYNCKSRHPVCWNDCEQYKSERAVLDAVNERRNAEAKSLESYRDYISAGKIRRHRAVHI